MGQDLVTVYVPGTERKEAARELLALARGAGMDPTVVQTIDGGFRIPRELATHAARDAALLPALEVDDDEDDVVVEDAPPVEVEQVQAYEQTGEAGPATADDGSQPDVDAAAPGVEQQAETAGDTPGDEPGETSTDDSTATADRDGASTDDTPADAPTRKSTRRR